MSQNSTQDDPLNKKTPEESGVEQEIIEDQPQEDQPPSVQAGQDDKDQKIEELKNALARAMADLQNFKRRSEEEKMSFIKYANVELLKHLLPLLDNLDRSILHLPETLKEDQWAKGIMHIHTDLSKTLDTLGVKKIKTLGEKLNPLHHEGLLSGPGEKDVIIEEFEPGYMLGDVVIKVARVKVGDGTEK